MATRWMCLLIALAAASCGRSAPDSASGSAAPAPTSGSALTKLTVAAIAIVDVAPLYLAQGQGVLRRREPRCHDPEHPGRRRVGARRGERAVSVRVCQRGLAAARPRQGPAAQGRSRPATSRPASREDFGADRRPGRLAGEDAEGPRGQDPGGEPAQQHRRGDGARGDAQGRRRSGPAEVHRGSGSPRCRRRSARSGSTLRGVVEPFLTVARSQGATVLDWNFADAAPRPDDRARTSRPRTTRSTTPTWSSGSPRR